MNRSVAMALLLAITLAFPGCGGDDGTGPGDDGGTVYTPGPYYGFFLDDAVKGLGYEYDGGAKRLTDENGAFEIEPDTPVRFYVDDLLLGTADDPRTRTTPNDLGSVGTNVARFIQSLDTRPGQPGIDLTGISLGSSPIDFAYSSEAFGTQPGVQAALDAAEVLGGTGILVTPSEASQRLSAGIGGEFDAAELMDTAIFPVDPVPDSELCYAMFFADGTGFNVCEDDIDEDPSSAGETFRWTVDGAELELEFPAAGTVLERVTVQRLGITGNRISTQTVSECLTCDPNVEPAIEAGVLTVVMPLPLSAADLTNRSILFADAVETTIVAFNGDGTGTVHADGEVMDMVWSVGSPLRNVLRVRGTGEAGSLLLYHELFLTRGTAIDGEFVALLGTTTDVDQNGEADESDFVAAGSFEGIDYVKSSLAAGR